MSRNLRSQSHSAAASGHSESPPGQVVGRQWEQMVMELLASCDNRPPDPGGFDDVAIAQYLSGGSSSAECAGIERAMAESPALSEGVALARQALAKTEAAA